MVKRYNGSLETPSAPLYHDIHEFINVMGIKQYRVMEAFGVSRSNWFYLKKRHLEGLSIKQMHSFATYFKLPPEKVMALCYMTYIRAMAQQVTNADQTEETEMTGTSDIDADFPPLG